MANPPGKPQEQRATIWSAPVKEKKKTASMQTPSFDIMGAVRQKTEEKKPDNQAWGFGEFGKYMEEKTRKLREQYQADADDQLFKPSPHTVSEKIAATEQHEGDANIFRGVSIHVNGYTQPSHQELRQLMLTHGGFFENYYSSSRVTHIICAHLPDGKYLDFRRKTSLPPIVRPEWVLDSIKANKLLPLDRYKLVRLAYDHPGQSTLDKAFRPPRQVTGPAQGLPAGETSEPANEHKGGTELQAQADEARPGAGPGAGAVTGHGTVLHRETGSFLEGGSMREEGGLGKAMDDEDMECLQRDEGFLKEGYPVEGGVSSQGNLAQGEYTVNGTRGERDEPFTELPAVHAAAVSDVGIECMEEAGEVDLHISRHGNGQTGQSPMFPNHRNNQGSAESPPFMAKGAVEGKARDPIPRQLHFSPVASSVLESEVANEASPSPLVLGPDEPIGLLDKRNRGEQKALVHFKSSVGEREAAQSTENQRGQNADTCPWKEGNDVMEERRGDVARLGGRAAGQGETSVQEVTVVESIVGGSPSKGGASGGTMRPEKDDAAAEVSPGKELPARSHSTKGDPNFLQNYYKYSRLHFIGTWRNRYQAASGSGSRPSPGSLADPPAPATEEATCPPAGDRPPKAVPSLGLGPKPKAGSGPGVERAIIHLDMDCFFVSVVVRHRPELVDRPVAVCHSDNSRGTAEISSANYAARKFGVGAGMFMREAKGRCPELTVVPYDFEAYEKVADQVYAILHRHSGVVQALSCDEAFLDVTGLGDPFQIALSIRREIQETTGCPASAGIGPNLLLARLATRKAKPNGQFRVLASEAADYIAELPVADLHGVGWALKEKLHSHGVVTCAQLRQLSRETLQREFGGKTGDMLWAYARGVDPRPVQAPQERKSIGAEVNWGIRFSTEEDAQKFLRGLVEEVCKRLRAAGTRGRTFSLKVKKRKSDAPAEPEKFMGCGRCDNMSRSASVGTATDDPAVLFRVSKQLYGALRLDPKEVRGIGLQVSRLELPAAAGTSARSGATASSLAGWVSSIGKVAESEGPQGHPGGEARAANEAESSGHEMSAQMGGRGSSGKDIARVNETLSAMEGKTTNGDTKRRPLWQTASEMDMGMDKKQSSAQGSAMADGEVREASGAQGSKVQLESRVGKATGAAEDKESAAGTGPSGHNVVGLLKAPSPKHGVLRATTGKPSVEAVFLEADAAPGVRQLSSADAAATADTHGRERAQGTASWLPPSSQLDPDVLAELPPDIVAEIQSAYGTRQGGGPGRGQPSSSRWGPAAAVRQGDADETGRGMGQGWDGEGGDRGGGGVQEPQRSASAETSQRPAPLGPSGKEGRGQVAAPEAQSLSAADRPAAPATAEEPGTRSDSMQALPPASQLDRSVLDFLPLAMRRELERAYEQQAAATAGGGAARRPASSPTRGAASTGGTRGRKRGRPPGRGAAKRQRSLLPLVRAASAAASHSGHTRSARSGPPASHSGATTGSRLSEEPESAACQLAEISSSPPGGPALLPRGARPSLPAGASGTVQLVGPPPGAAPGAVETRDCVLSLTQIDAGVLAELPLEVQRDVLRACPSHRPRRAGQCPPVSAPEAAERVGVSSRATEWEKENGTHHCAFEREDHLGMLVTVPADGAGPSSRLNSDRAGPKQIQRLGNGCLVPDVVETSVRGVACRPEGKARPGPAQGREPDGGPEGREAPQRVAHGDAFPQSQSLEQPEGGSAAAAVARGRHGPREPPLEGLWEGDPPRWTRLWVRKKTKAGLREDEAGPLELLAEFAVGEAPGLPFSQSLTRLGLEGRQDRWQPVGAGKVEEAVRWCAAVVAQYVKAVGRADLEEVHAVVRAVARLGKRWPFWRLVQSRIMPAVQAFVQDVYGGHLLPGRLKLAGP